MKRFTALLIILSLLLIGFGGFGAFAFITKGTTIAFNDIVMFVIALVGLLIALASIGIWAALRRVLHEDIALEISRVEKATRNEALSRMAAKLASSFWAFYGESKNKVFRDQAIKIIHDAREILEGRGEIESEELKCWIYNNLAFAYAERGKAEDTKIAHFLINYVMERYKDFPEDEINSLETYAYVLYRLPKKHDDKKKALDIINELLQRPDMSGGLKRKYRQRYSITDTKEGGQPNLDKSS